MQYLEYFDLVTLCGMRKWEEGGNRHCYHHAKLGAVLATGPVGTVKLSGEKRTRLEEIAQYRPKNSRSTLTSNDRQNPAVGAE